MENEAVCNFKEFFELEKCLNWIVLNAYKRVALQFPDIYLNYSFKVAQFLENSSSAKVYVLGDTSYGSCCVDEITAEHAQCDSLIHFGDACLSAPVERIPVLYIFCQCRLNVNKFEQEFKNIFNNRNYEAENFAILFDSAFANEIDELRRIIAKQIPKVQVFWLTNVNEAKSFDNKLSCSKTVLGRNIPDCVKNWHEATLIFIGFPSSPLFSIWLMTFVQFTKILNYLPDEHRFESSNSTSAKLLRKRHYLVERLRDSKRIGLVVGTLAVCGFTEAIKRIRELCKISRKRLYVFSIGKINEAKLSNFADNVDAFILLSCPFGIILNTIDFYLPILSVFEAEIALNPSKDWFSSGSWTSEFGKFLKDQIGEAKHDKTDVSLITGGIRATNFEDENEKNLNSDEKKKQVVQYAPGNYFANRSWKGLNDEDLEDETTITTQLKKGLDGIAVSYISEKN